MPCPGGGHAFYMYMMDIVKIIIYLHYIQYLDHIYNIGQWIQPLTFDDLDFDLVTYFIFQAIALKFGLYLQLPMLNWMLTFGDLDFDLVTYFLIFQAIALKFGL